MFRIAVENHNVLVVCETVLAYSAFHSRLGLVVVAVLDLKKTEYVASQCNFLLASANLSDFVFNFLHSIDNLLALTLGTHQLTHLVHKHRLKAQLNPLLKICLLCHIASHH